MSTTGRATTCACGRRPRPTRRRDSLQRSRATRRPTGSTSRRRLVEALVAGDVIEVHSGIFQTAPVSWIDADPADVWDGILALVPVPPERIGAGWLPRGGKPPRVTDIAPGDAATQAKRKITVRLSEEESADELLDQISIILGGVTLEIDGNIVFVQIIPLTDVGGTVTVPLPPPAAVFDARDISSLGTPPGLRSGRRSSAASTECRRPRQLRMRSRSKSTTSVDQDALLWLAQQDIEDYGLAVISVTRETGTPDPPVPTIVPLNGETDDTIRILQFNATAGTGGGGANLTYDVRIKVGFAAETSLASGNATTLPLTINVARHIRNDKYIRFIVTDTATGLTRTAYYDIPSQRQEIDDTIPSRLTSAVTHSGGTGVNRLLAKTLPADPDNADSVLAGLNKRIPLIGATDSSGNVDMAGVSWVNRNADNLGRSAGDATHVAVIVDRLTNLGNAASNMQESGGKAVNRLLGKALAADPDSLDGAPDGVTYKRVVSVVSGQITPASSTSRNRCKVVQTITLANNTPTFFTPTTEAYDTGNLHDTATSPSHITVPAGGNTGAWLLHGTVDFAANAAGYRSVGIYKNGVLVESSTLPPATGVLTSIPVSFLDDAPAVGDYYELLATQTSGGNLSTTGTFTAIHLW
jgi:hypothetical protein